MDNAHNASSSTNAPSSSSSSRTTNAQPSSSSTVRLAPSSSNSASMTHSASATGPSFEIPISHEPITIEGSLAAHASYADPTRAALETVIADRNTFSAQNVQLWNHMRKQRSYHIHLVKDVDRLRHERDVLRHKLSKYEKTGREPHSSERPLKATASSSRVNGTDTPTGPAIEREDRPSSTSRTIPDPRAGVARHKSDETHGESILHVLPCPFFPIFIPMLQLHHKELRSRMKGDRKRQLCLTLGRKLL
jgi:RalA-binding protein 1